MFEMMRFFRGQYGSGSTLLDKFSLYMTLSIISPNKTKSRLNNNTRNILHYQPEEALKNFDHVKSLNLEIPSSEEKNDKSFLKWTAEFGTSFKSCVIIGANSISKNDNENSQSRIESQPLILSDEELKLRIVWMISSLMAASSRHYMLKRIVVDFPTISNVVVSDEEKRGKVYMGAEQLSELRLNSVNDEFKLSLERSVIPDLRMKVWYVPKLELGCGLVMSGATLVVIRPMPAMEVDPAVESEPEIVNFGKSIIVPSVQELAKLPLLHLPPRYCHCFQQSPINSNDPLSIPSIPIIDLHRLGTTEFTDSEVQRLHSACREWGFFQVINHGISTSLLDKFRTEVENFFKLPYEEKKRLWQHPDNHEGFGQLFVVSEEQKLDWSDMFYITTLPLNLRKTQLFEKLPIELRDTMEAYSMEVKKLAMVILDHMAKALKMDGEEMRDLFGEGVQSIRMNYYPPCPEPDLAIGFTPHSDADALTILFQLNDTEGLQIRKDGNWVSVTPLPNALVVNIGDVMEIVSNGTYKSIEHRATVNSSKERLSVATFYSSKLDSELGPALSIIGPENPAIFRRVPIENYFKEFFARKLSGKSYLDFMKVKNKQ
uniref:Fe2OG dioxygenase domain-containing protein n=1 Tax=Cannabis sativa TaxID=3483 RepID=A0A803QF06_CANSA